MVDGENARKQVQKILDVSSRHTGAVAVEIKALAAQAVVNVDQLIVNAERYQWLREQAWFQAEIDERYGQTTNLEAMDRVIDGAKAAQAKQI